MQVPILRDKPDSPWKTISEAFRLRFEPGYKWGAIIGNWFVWMLLIGIGYLAIHFSIYYGVFGGVKPDQTTWQTYVLRQSAYIPAFALATSFLWALDLCITQRALEQLRGTPVGNPNVGFDLRRWREFFWAALISHIGAILLGWLIYLISRNYVNAVTLLIQPLAGAPFLYVLPLMSDRRMTLREAATTSFRATKSWIATCVALFWVLQMVTSLLIAVNDLPVLKQVQGVRALLAYGSYIVAIVLLPIPFIGAAILYRKQFGDPEVVKPPMIDDLS